MNNSTQSLTKESSYRVSEWEEYARLHASVTTSVQLDLYREACTYLFGDVIDLGCGSAKIAPLLADNALITSYTGVDYAQEMVTVAKQVIKTSENKAFNILHSKIEDVMGRYNSGVSIQSYYAWHDPVSTLRHIFNLFDKKAIFVLATPNKVLDIDILIREAERELIAHPDFIAYKRYNQQLAKNPGANFVTMDKLIGQAQEAGFEVLECHQRHFQKGINFLVLYKDG